MEHDGRRIAVQEIPKEIIARMDYQTRLKNYEQEKEEYLRSAGRKPWYEYSETLRHLAEKWRV